MAESYVGVIDASTLAAVLFGEPEATDLDMDVVPSRLAASPLLPHEFANICIKKHRRARMPINEVLDTFRLFESLNIATLPISQPEVVALAIRYELSSYDAGYLWLALLLDIPLLTLDKKLDAAYRKACREIA